MKLNYIKNKENKYLVSGPAPIGRILNYIKRIKKGDYKTSIRGPSDSNNLDDWTVCFMVGLDLIKKPRFLPNLTILLTGKGEKIYAKIKNLQDFIDQPITSKSNMLKIKKNIQENNIWLYNLLKKILRESDPIKNLLIYFKNKNINFINKQKFYRGFGRIFKIDKAGFNRLPSLLQIAEFIDILIEEKEYIHLNVSYEIQTKKSLIEEKNIIREISKKTKIKNSDNSTIEDFIKDSSKTIEPKRKEKVVKIILRDAKRANKLKEYYNHKCQICGKVGFLKINGKKYSEAHHLISLGEKGSNEYSNLIIVCPDCHKKLHYAKINIGSFSKNKRNIQINNKKGHITYKSEHL